MVDSPANKFLAVNLGELKISRDPEHVLVAYGLGSCLGIGMFAPEVGVAGLLHAVLPSRNGKGDQPPLKYVDSGIHALVEELIAEGASKDRIVIRMVGGANMLTAPGFKQVLNIGERNIKNAHATFEAMKLKITAEEVGGNIGRTVRLHVADGRMIVRTMGKHEKEI